MRRWSTGTTWCGRICRRTTPSRSSIRTPRSTRSTSSPASGPSCATSRSTTQAVRTSGSSTGRRAARRASSSERRRNSGTPAPPARSLLRRQAANSVDNGSGTRSGLRTRQARGCAARPRSCFASGGDDAERRFRDRRVRNRWRARRSSCEEPMLERLLTALILATVTCACGSGAAQSGAAQSGAAQSGSKNADTAGGEPATVGLSADDHVAIRNLAGRYSQALDLGDPAAWAEVFTDDGVMDMVAQGYEIKGEALRSLPRDGEPSRGRHIPTTFVIDGAGDEATMRSYVTVVSTDDPARIVFQGRYEDRLRRVDGRWRIERRRILTDWIDSAVAEGVADAP
ncbi:MAG: nuclear transport factor 2 family protein [Acidobacteria bacterium]|nr:nuclear transport factor 2 family protein [Acidobacteriota bacterium]